MKAFITSMLSMSLLLPAGTFISVARAQGNRPSAPARASITQQPADGGWPRAYITSSGARLVRYEPQIASWLESEEDGDVCRGL